jgi:hypothetical protein
LEDYQLLRRVALNTIPRTTETLYDVTGNKTDVTFPDTRSHEKEKVKGKGVRARY